MSSRQTFAVLAWYRQFYLFDPGKPCNTDGSEFWSEEAVQSGLAVETGWLGIGTDTDGEVPVRVSVRLRRLSGVGATQGKCPKNGRRRYCWLTALAWLAGNLRRPQLSGE